MVTEHLPNNRAVVEGIFQWTKPGDLLALKHHNYYGFDGHHQKLGDESSMNMYIWYAYVFIYIVHMLLQKYVFVFFICASRFFGLFSAWKLNLKGWYCPRQVEYSRNVIAMWWV